MTSKHHHTHQPSQLSRLCQVLTVWSSASSSASAAPLCLTARGPDRSPREIKKTRCNWLIISHKLPSSLNSHPLIRQHLPQAAGAGHAAPSRAAAARGRHRGHCALPQARAAAPAPGRSLPALPLPGQPRRAGPFPAHGPAGTTRYRCYSHLEYCVRFWALSSRTGN